MASVRFTLGGLVDRSEGLLTYTVRKLEPGKEPRKIDVMLTCPAR